MWHNVVAFRVNRAPASSINLPLSLRPAIARIKLEHYADSQQSSLTLPEPFGKAASSQEKISRRFRRFLLNHFLACFPFSYRMVMNHALSMSFEEKENKSTDPTRPIDLGPSEKSTRSNYDLCACRAPVQTALALNKHDRALRLSTHHLDSWIHNTHSQLHLLADPPKTKAAHGTKSQKSVKQTWTHTIINHPHN